MSIIFYTILVISTIIISIYDYKIQKIPWWILVINYSCISMLITPWMLFGNIMILIIKKIDAPIDYMYLIILLCIMILNPLKLFNFIIVSITIIYILIAKNEKISFMIPLTINISILLGIIVFHNMSAII